MTIRRSGRVAGIVAACALALSACGSTPATPPPITGVPSASIEVPLSNVGCATSGTCLAVGTSNRVSGLATLAEDRTGRGPWRDVTVPAVSSARLEAMACAVTVCLVGGTRPTGTFLWRYDARTRTFTTLSPPAGEQDVRALSCSSDTSCALVDSTSVVSAARIAFTTDAGASWTTPRPIPSTQNATVTALACEEHACVVAASTGSTPLLETTSDAGANWTSSTLPRAWHSLSDLTCWAAHCAALALGDGVALVRSRDFATTWTTLALPNSTRALACSNLSRCVVVGESNGGAGWLATVRERRLRVVSLDYVPTPLTDVACATHACAAIGASTLVALSN